VVDKEPLSKGQKASADSEGEANDRDGGKRGLRWPSMPFGESVVKGKRLEDVN